MSDWKVVELGDISEVITKGTTPTTYGHHFSEAGVRFFRVNNISNGGYLDTKDCLYIDERTNSFLKRSQLKRWDILISIAGSIGRTAIVKESVLPANCNQAVAIIRLKKDQCPRFIARLLSSEQARRAVSIDTVQLAQANFSLGQIQRLTFPIPPRVEQEKCSDIIDTLDTTIRQTEAIIAKLQQVKQGLLHDLLTRGIDANGQLRPPAEQAPRLYKESPLGWIPREWEVCLLDEVAIRGSGHTPNKSVLGYWNGGIKWVSLADSDKLDQIFIWDTDKQISELGIANSSAVKHPSGTVILSRDAGVGKSAILGEQMAVSQHFMAWQCGKRLNNVFLYYWLQSIAFLYYLWKMFYIKKYRFPFSRI